LEENINDINWYLEMDNEIPEIYKEPINENNSNLEKRRISPLSIS